MWLKCSLYGKNWVFFLLPAIFFELPITRTFFYFPWRFELSGVDSLYRKKKPNPPPPQPLELIWGITVEHVGLLRRTRTDKNCRCSRCLTAFPFFFNTRAWYKTGIPSSRSKLSLNPVIPMVIFWILHLLYTLNPEILPPFCFKTPIPRLSYNANPGSRKHTGDPRNITLSRNSFEIDHLLTRHV